jgi:hypothetical protein
MKHCYHIPARLHWQVEPTAEENARLHRTITDAIRRAVASVIDEAAEVVVTDFEIHRQPENYSRKAAIASNMDDSSYGCDGAGITPQ